MSSLLWILTGMGCSATAVPLGSVTEAAEHPETERFALTAQTEQGHLGVAEQAGPGGTGLVWVVPVVDVHGELGSSVDIWVTPPTPAPAGTDPEVWLARLRDRFDDIARTRPVIARVGEDAASPIERAVRDAETRHGIRSVPHAPVLACCD